MPPKRPRIVPSQTDLSVQDVRDYSTPDGASMANEEMRRLKLAIDQLKKEAEPEAPSTTIVSGGGAQASGDGGDVIVLPEVSYKWFVKAENYVAAEVKDGDTVIFRGVNGINVSQVGRRITISQPVLSWILRADVGILNVLNEQYVRIAGKNGVTTSVDASTRTMYVDRPLTVYQRSIAIGDAGTIGLDFFNATNYKPADYILPVYFQITDRGSGVRRINGWVISGGGSTYHWHASDGQQTHQVVSGSTVIWQGTNGVVVTLVPGQHTFTIDRPLQIQQKDTNIGGQDTIELNMDNVTVQKPLGHNSRVWTEVVDNGNGKRSLRFFYDPAGTTTTSLQIQQRSIDIGGDDTGTLNFDNEVNVKPQNYTGRVYAQVIDDTNGKRSVRLWHTPGDLNFNKWLVAANGTPGGGQAPSTSEVRNDDKVTFWGVNGISVSRNTSGANNEEENIYIGINANEPPWGDPTAGLDWKVTGILEFDNTNDNYFWDINNQNSNPVLQAKPAWRYGYRKYRDINHNWNLTDPKNIEVHLLDWSIDESAVLQYYRSGATTMAGETLSNQLFRNFVHWSPLDNNTVRFYATMSRGKPTPMRFRYSIRKL